MINNYSYDPDISRAVSDKYFETNVAKKHNYTEIYGNEGLEKNTVKKDNRTSRNVGIANDIFKMTMGQNQYFKLTIDGLMVNNSMLHSSKAYVTENGKVVLKDIGYGQFLPVKNITYKPVSIESTRLQFGIFSDFPIIHKRKIGSIQITLLDTVNNEYERAVYDWFGSCIPTSTGFVAPLAEIIRKTEYIEYNNKGQVSKKYSFEVIPDGEVSSSRNYEDGNLKEVTFTVLIVSDIAGEVNPESIKYHGTGASAGGNSSTSTPNINDQNLVEMYLKQKDQVLNGVAPLPANKIQTVTKNTNKSKSSKSNNTVTALPSSKAAKGIQGLPQNSLKLNGF